MSDEERTYRRAVRAQFRAWANRAIALRCSPIVCIALPNDWGGDSDQVMLCAHGIPPSDVQDLLRDAVKQIDAGLFRSVDTAEDN